MASKLKPGDCPLSGAEAVAAMTNSRKPGLIQIDPEQVRRDLLKLRAELRGNLALVENIIQVLDSKPGRNDGSTRPQKR